MKVVVIIPAAGLGTRMAAAESAPRSAVGKGPAKQFADLHGVPILFHTLRAFASSPQVSEIYVAVRKSEADSFGAKIVQEKLNKKILVVDGGEHRQESVANALNAISAAPEDIVLVHDAVRPLVDHEIIAAVIAGVEKHGAAIAGVPAVDTVKQVERAADAAIVTSTIPRERVVLAQTPQGFRFGVLKAAFAEAAADGFLGTDEASLVERSGGAVAVVMGSTRNLKITTPADLELAEFYLAQTTRRRAAG
jgi:2-C-methyl-D-erythritol 4-phosphate cytidylyltransferase